MEKSRKVVLLNKAFNCCAKYGKYAIWSLYGLTTFYALKFFKNQFLASPTGPNSLDSDLLEVNLDAADLPKANLSTTDRLKANPETLANLLFSNQPDTNPEDAELPEANLSTTNSLQVDPSAADSLEANLSTLYLSDANSSVDNQNEENLILEVYPEEAGDLSEANLSTANPDGLEENPETDNILDANPSITNQPDANLKAAKLPEENIQTTRFSDPPDGNLWTYYLPDSNLLNPDFNLMQPSTNRLLNLVPKALVGEQSNGNLEILSDYLDKIEWLDLMKNYSDNPIWDRSKLVAVTQSHQERSKTLKDPFSTDTIEFPDLEDQASVNDYIDLHFNLSQNYFEEGEYKFGFYHFVLLQFAYHDPMAHLDSVRELIENETYLLARRFLENLMIILNGQVKDN